MPWPSDQDYNEAVQNPRTAFADPELQVGQVELYPTGLPKPRSGNFATVYKIVSNGTAHAVRCFRYDNPEHDVRYPAIASHLALTHLPYMVSFRYMSQGIRVGPRRYPILKMKWVEGDSLISYVEKHLASRTVLENLAAEWASMTDDLQQAQIAHGDLQHGNVIVVNGAIKLVDYDGMYVPALEGRHGIELGHRNYQHPERSELDFGPHLDNFSAWLIYVSLLALAARPNLRQQLRAGDEQLLFRMDDLAEPDRSAAFQLLRAVPDERVRALAEQLESFLWQPLDQIPGLNKRSSEPTKRPERPPLPPPVVEPEEGVVPIPQVPDSTWIQDHIPEEVVTDSFQNQVVLDRLTTLAVFSMAALLCYWLTPGRAASEVAVLWLASLFSAGCLNVAIWRIRYGREPVCAKIRTIRAQFAEAARRAEAARISVENLRTRWQRRNDTYSAERSKLRSQQSALQADEAQEVNLIEASRQARLQQITAKRRSLTAEEGSEKRKLADTVGGRIARLSHQLADLLNQERNEIGRIEASSGVAVRSLQNQLQAAQVRKEADLRQALKEYQDQIANGHLHRFRISDASIPGIGPQLKRRLAVAGYTSAGDIGTRFVDVPGIGSMKWNALQSWRRQLEGPIRAREAPKTLPPHKSANIEQRHDPAIGQLQQSLSSERARLASSVDAIRRKYAELQKRAGQEKATEETSLRQQVAAVEKRFRDARDLLSSEEAQVRSQSGRAIAECRMKYIEKAAQLTKRLEQVRLEYRTDMENVAKEFEEAAKLSQQSTWQRERIARKLSAYTPLTFRRYVLRTVGL
ncbi:MAG: hypothetical protein FJ279_12065 [Planctomycetes bacterium]|nr:hypothetical protein [Planctomycetota bacterium]